MIWCLHGSVGHHTDWNALASQLAQSGWAVRKVDLWRYLECRSITLSEFGDIFLSEVRAQDTAPILIGYSLGGRLALHALLSESSHRLWKGAILLGTHPGLVTEEQRGERRRRDAEWGTACLQQKWSTFLTDWNKQSILTGQCRGLADRAILQPRKQAIARSFFEWSLGAQSDLRGALSAVECPVQLITGERDEKFTQLAAEMSTSLPAAQLTCIAQAGHRTLWESPVQTTREIQRFITSLDLP